MADLSVCFVFAFGPRGDRGRAPGGAAPSGRAITTCPWCWWGWRRRQSRGGRLRETSTISTAAWNIEERDNKLMALHFNSPIYNAIKPWLWYWYPLFPSHWLWWQVRRQVAGEAAAAIRLLCAGVVGPVLLSIWFTWRGPRCLLALVDNASTLRVLQVNQKHYYLRRLLWRVPFFSIVVSALVFAVIPSQADAFVAWASYFVCKGCIFGFVSFGTSRVGSGQQGIGTAFGRLRWTLFGYVCMLLELLVIWLPQCRGAHWVSDKLLAPVCSRTSEPGVALLLAQVLGCNATAWIVIVSCVLVVVVSQSLLFWCTECGQEAIGSGSVAECDFIDVWIRKAGMTNWSELRHLPRRRGGGSRRSRRAGCRTRADVVRSGGPRAVSRPGPTTRSRA
ncbi:unnamed protein product [Prorocentrum cordatum]|uniref:Uncharacterized protein n=1 Tax=Prorocentrum cordatum TaxID=2364126 RepID=A0ABN9RHD1_9DINO|nr:unnamed protein product [Polarella glacialis]